MYSHIAFNMLRALCKVKSQCDIIINASLYITHDHKVSASLVSRLLFNTTSRQHGLIKKK